MVHREHHLDGIVRTSYGIQPQIKLFRFQFNIIETNLQLVNYHYNCTIVRVNEVKYTQSAYHQFITISGCENSYVLPDTILRNMYSMNTIHFQSLSMSLFISVGQADQLP